MNSAVRAVVRSALKEGCEAYAIFEGYQGLVEGGDLIKNMGWADVRGFSVSGSIYFPKAGLLGVLLTSDISSSQKEGL